MINKPINVTDIIMTACTTIEKLNAFSGARPKKEKANTFAP
jgi:hypothetical protein